MRSKTNGETYPALIRFPEDQTRPTTDRDRDIAERHFVKTHDVCIETAQALRELRHGVEYILFDTLERMDLDERDLVEILDERPSVVTDLMDRQTEGLTTERLIEILETIRPLLHS
jgi:hypothetical protein